MLNNLYPESIEESGNYLRIVLQYISKYKLPYNPITYALWYEYVTGRNQQLMNDIHALETENREIPYATILTLFREHVADSQLLLAETKGGEFQTILTEMIQQLGNSCRKVGNQGITLEGYAQKLGHTPSAEIVSAIAKNIILETKSIAAESQVLKNKMETTALEIISLKEQLEGIQQAAKTDMLTGLLNRRGFDEAMAVALQNCVTHHQPLSLILADIDHFKQINDTHGHLIGDNVLKILSRLLQKQIKGKDIAARFGGEEFIIILPQTPLKGAFAVAEQIRKTLEEIRWTTRGSGKAIGTITISLGVAQYKEDETIESLIARSDNALYSAKKAGRNRTMTEMDRGLAGYSTAHQPLRGFTWKQQNTP